jgi:hypothetical protein
MAAKDWADEGLQPLLDRHAAGEEAAADELIVRLAGLVQRMAGAGMRGRFARLLRWYQAEDVAQEVAIRLRRALAVKKPREPKELIGLAYLQLDRVLKDYYKHKFRKRGSGRHHATPPLRQPSDWTGKERGKAIDRAPVTCPRFLVQGVWE